MPKRKSYADTGGITQRATKARALSADDALVGANGGSDCAHPGTVDGATKHMMGRQLYGAGFKSGLGAKCLPLMCKKKH